MMSTIWKCYCSDHLHTVAKKCIVLDIQCLHINVHIANILCLFLNGLFEIAHETMSAYRKGTSSKSPIMRLYFWLQVVICSYVTFVTATLSEIDRKRRGSKTILNPADRKGEAKNRIPNLISLLSIPECTEISSKGKFLISTRPKSGKLICTLNVRVKNINFLYQFADCGQWTNNKLCYVLPPIQK